MHDDLTRLAILHGTDKFGYHDYTPNYYALFRRFRDKPIRFLEIGVGGYGAADRGGESLAVWRDFFPAARVTGIDIQKKSLDLGPRVRILEGSQVDPEFLAGIERSEGPFDLIVDDGSHRNDHVLESFRLLFPGLREGGIYVVEDTQTAFYPNRGGSLELTQPNSVGYFADMLGRLLGPESGAAELPVAIERFHNMVVLHKRGPADAPRPAWISEVAAEAAGAVVRGAGDAAAARDLIADLAPGAAITVAETGKAESGKAETGKAETGKGAPPGLVVCPPEAVAAMTGAEFEAAFAALGPRGALVLMRPEGGVGEALAGFLARRFVEVDHVALRNRFPEAEVHPLARDIRAISASAEMIALHKAPNDYPSNAAFNPEQPQAKAALARMAEVMEEAEEAPGRMNYVELMLGMGRLDEAARQLAKVGGREARSARYHNLALVVARRRKRSREVPAILEAALSDLPDNPFFAAELADHHVGRREPKKALALLGPAHEAHPESHLILAALARAHFALGDGATAEGFARTALPRTPGHARWKVLWLMARIRLDRGDLDGAGEILARAEEISPTQPQTVLLRCDLHLRRGDTEAARAVLGRALAAHPKHPGLLRRQEEIGRA